MEHNEARPAPVGTPPEAGFGTVLAVSAVVTVGVLPVFLVGGLAVQVRADLGLSVGLVGLAASAFFTLSALVARPLAVVTERVGPAVALRVAAIGSAACLGALAAAPSQLWLLLALCAAGVPTALSQPAANAILMARVAEQRRGFAFAVKQSAIPAAILLAGIAVPTLALTVGWRWVFAVAALLGLVAAVTAPSLLPRAAPGRSDRRRGPAGRVLVALAVVTGLGAGAANAMGTFGTISAVDVGYSEAAAGLVLALASAVGLGCRLAAGAIADWMRPDLLGMVTIMLGVGSIGFVLLALGHPVTFLIGLVLGFGAGWSWPGVFNFAVSARFPNRVAAATSVTQTGVYIGAGLGPLLFGLLAQHVGTSAAWIAACVTMMCATATLLVVRCRPTIRA